MEVVLVHSVDVRSVRRVVDGVIELLFGRRPEAVLLAAVVPAAQGRDTQLVVIEDCGDHYDGVVEALRTLREAETVKPEDLC